MQAQPNYAPGRHLPAEPRIFNLNIEQAIQVHVHRARDGVAGRPPTRMLSGNRGQHARPAHRARAPQARGGMELRTKRRVIVKEKLCAGDRLFSLVTEKLCAGDRLFSLVTFLCLVPISARTLAGGREFMPDLRRREFITSARRCSGGVALAARAQQRRAGRREVP